MGVRLWGGEGRAPVKVGGFATGQQSMLGNRCFETSSFIRVSIVCFIIMYAYVILKHLIPNNIRLHKNFATANTWLKDYTVRFQVLTAMSINVDIFWDAALCGVVETNRRFRGARLQGDRPHGRSKHLWNVNQFLPRCTAQQPGRRPSSEKHIWAQVNNTSLSVNSN
jgi:hypothetical protein